MTVCMIPTAMSLSQSFSESYVLFQEMLRAVLAERGLSGRVQPGTGPVLFALHREDDRTISDVGDGLGLARSTMTSVIARLEKGGLVTSRRDPEDGRAKRLKLTVKGRKVLEEMLGVAAQMDEILGSTWSETKRDQVDRDLRAMRERMRDALSKSR